jgi:hypothetical protein
MKQQHSALSSGTSGYPISAAQTPNDQNLKKQAQIYRIVVPASGRLDDVKLAKARTSKPSSFSKFRSAWRISSLATEVLD